jgi:hypothetical protein
MGLVTVNTIEIDGQPRKKLQALNSSMISQLDESDGHASFTFTPFSGRRFNYLIKEDKAYILSAIRNTTDFNVTFNKFSGTQTINTANISMIYDHPSNDRSYVEYISGGNTTLTVVTHRMLDVVNLINTSAKYTDSEAVASFGNRSKTVTTGIYDDLGVTNINFITFNSNGGNITLRGLEGGTDKQIIFCHKRSNNNAVVLNYNDANGVEKLLTPSAANETLLGGDFGCFVLIYFADNNYWYVLKGY